MPRSAVPKPLPGHSARNECEDENLIKVDTASKFISREKARGDVFKLLAACFYLPEKELLAQESVLENLALLMESVCPKAWGYVLKMEGAFKIYSEEDLQVEYARLFIGPNELIAPPFGSVYLEHGKRVMGDSTLAVSRIYAEEGLVLDEDVKQPPDHIAIELEFVHYLITREIQALNEEDEASATEHLKKQSGFLEKNLAAWVPEFTKSIREGTENRYYRALAECLEAFIECPPRQDA